jgi:hypothetical protein
MEVRATLTWLLSLKQVYSLGHEKRIIDGIEFKDMNF